MRSSKIGTVALIIREGGEKTLDLVEKFSDDREIAAFEAALRSGEEDPLASVYTMRQQQTKEDEEFGDYVEELLSQPFVRPEIQEHGVQWLKSKIRIEDFQRTEREATQIIAEYAFRLFTENPERTDFYLAGPQAKVRVRVFTLRRVKKEMPPRSHAA